MKWSLESRRLIYQDAILTAFWDMPDGYVLPSAALLNLAEFLLIGPHGVDVPQSGTRSFGARVAVAYSGGVDSTAALSLLPDPVPIYMQTANPSPLHNQENALLALREVDGIAILSNSNEVALKYGRSRGFFGAGGFTIPLVLLADHFGLGTVADGNVLETIYMHHGTKFSPRDDSRVIGRFAAAGLHYCMPCAGLTEVSTTRLIGTNKYAMGCMRGSGGNPCENCAKCYRKLAIQGRPIDPCEESERKISREVIPMLPSLLWAVKHRGLVHEKLSMFDNDVSWTDKWYVDALKYVPTHLWDFVSKRIENYGIEPMYDIRPMLQWESSQEAT